jgi:transposase
MNYVGADLHKKTITLCVMDQNRKVLGRKTLYCVEPHQIPEYLESFRPFEIVVEATASYLWFVDLVQPLAQRVVLANPSKLRVIAESTKKTDRLDAQTLAEFLARDMIPEAHQPGPRQRQHRTLVRQRHYLRGRTTSVKNKIRRILGDYNADRKNLFSAELGLTYIQQVPLSDADRFVINQLWAEYLYHDRQIDDLNAQIKAFAAKAPAREKEAREVLKTIPYVGPVTIEVVVSELGDIQRFRNAKAASAYSGLVPAVRQTGGKKSHDLRITKEGSGILRWALVESAWRLVGHSQRWKSVYERIKKRSGAKRAIVAVARKLMCVIYAMLKTMTPYKVITP